MKSQETGLESVARARAATVIAFSCLLALYFIVRYGGWTMDGDVARQTTAANGIIGAGRLVHLWSYDNGYGYAALLAFLSQATGVAVQPLQLASSLGVVAVAVAALMTYREMLGGRGAAALAAFLLLVQPDFLFYMLRNSHEKVTWTLALLMLFLLWRSQRDAGDPQRLAIHVGLFYVAFAGMAATNVFFASSLILPMLVIFTGEWLLERLHWGAISSDDARDSPRLVLVTASCLVIVFIVIAYMYEPALKALIVSYLLADRVGIVALGAEAASTPVPYQSLATTWRSSGAYLALTGVQWAIAVTSLVSWLVMARRLKQMDGARRFLWLIYTGYGFQLALGVVVDFAGVLSSNMQLRLFTPFALFSSPMTALLIVDALPWLPARGRRLLVPLGVALCVWAAVAAPLKVTNDPLFGNQWLFYSPAEVGAARWIRARSQAIPMWLDMSEHIPRAVEFWEDFPPADDRWFEYGSRRSPTAYILMSRLLQLRASRIGMILSQTDDRQKVYDNGTAEIYHRRAQTPYQR